MNVKIAIAIILGLLLQLVQVSQASVPAGDCGEFAASHCECCAGQSSCPCVTDEDQRPDRPPLPAPAESSKLPAAKLTEPPVIPEDALALTSPRRSTAIPAVGSASGYAGVRLSVAFCSFVI